MITCWRPLRPRHQQQAANAKAKERVAELQEFVRRFSANKSKAKQATSRARQIEKIKVEDVKPSSRVHPFIRFEASKKLHRLAVEAEKLSKSYDKPIFRDFSIMIEAGEKVAIIGANGAGKTTLLRCLGGEVCNMKPDSGTVKWAEHADIGYMAQDSNEEFENELNLTDWMTRFTQEGDDDQAVRSILGRLLFSGDEVKNRPKCSPVVKRPDDVWQVDARTPQRDADG